MQSTYLNPWSELILYCVQSETQSNTAAQKISDWKKNAQALSKPYNFYDASLSDWMWKLRIYNMAVPVKCSRVETVIQEMRPCTSKVLLMEDSTF